ncbi:MAG: type II toxin-antitoxin system prevent-host-death family antitoxin [Pseudomonadota bacterium]
MEREGPQEITVYGRPVAVVLSEADYERLNSASQSLVDSCLARRSMAWTTSSSSATVASRGQRRFAIQSALNSSQRPDAASPIQKYRLIRPSAGIPVVPKRLVFGSAPQRHRIAPRWLSRPRLWTGRKASFQPSLLAASSPVIYQQPVGGAACSPKWGGPCRLSIACSGASVLRHRLRLMRHRARDLDYPVLEAIDPWQSSTSAE